MPPLDERTKRQRRAWALVLFCGIAALGAHTASAVGPHGSFAVFVATSIAFQVFNLWDAVVIDVPLVLTSPRWAFLPGAESSPSYRDPRWHIANYAKGVVVGLVCALVVTTLDAAIRTAT